jgi:uncharacterized membrane protein
MLPTLTIFFITPHFIPQQYTMSFTKDNEPDGIENATHNTFAKQTWIFVF